MKCFNCKSKMFEDAGVWICTKCKLTINMLNMNTVDKWKLIKKLND